MSAPEEAGSFRSYQPIAEIGRGGMASVFLAAVRGTAGFNKLVVVKKTRSDLAIEGDVMAMFLDEARISARMNHPNVVQTYEIGQEGGQYFIAMEYLDGQPYSRVVARLRGQLPLAMHLRVVADVLAGLHHAHELRDFDGTPLDVVHRDVTPQNVFITYDGSIKVVDFGIAKAVDAMSRTSTGVVKGKVSYMSPEQARGDPLDRHTDVFAAGVMLWEAIAGRRMWGALPDLTVTHELLYDRVPPLAEAAAGVPPALSAIVARALAPRREDRYATALDMANDVEAFLAQAGLHASAREVGAHIAPAFEPERRRVREVIEAQLRDLRWTGVQPRASIEDLPSIDLPPDSTPPGPVVPTHSGAAVPLPPAAPPRPLLVPVAVAAAFALAVASTGILLFARPGREARPASTASASPAPAESAAAPVTTGESPTQPDAGERPQTIESVTLTVRAKPADVRVYLDGVLLSTGPFTGKVGRSAAPRTVRVEAERYRAKEEQVTFGSDVVLSFDLEREAPPPAGGRAAPGPPRGGKPKYGIEADSPYRR